MFRFSIVIPTYRRSELLRKCLVSCEGQESPPYELIVVDDASPDDTSSMMRREFPKAHYLRLERNSGPATARNRGIAASGGDIVVFTDDDCLLPHNFSSRLAEGYSTCPDIAGAGGYLEAPEELLTHNPYAQYDYYMTHNVYGFGPLPVLGGLECPAGGTHSMSYRRQVLAEVGGFDESFPVPGGEDADLKVRVVSRGYALLYVPVKVIHQRPYTLRDFWRQYYAHGRGSVPYERKHHGNAPSLGRLGLRLGVRIGRVAPDTFRIGPRLAILRMLAALADLAGQWHELRR